MDAASKGMLDSAGGDRQDGTGFLRAIQSSVQFFLDFFH
jgi:hypothetical protein